MTVKELRRYRTICVEIEQFNEKLLGSKMHDEKQRTLLNEKKHIEQFINAIPDYRVRRALEIYCLYPLDTDMEQPSWEKVADIMGDGSTGSSLKMLVSRYFQKI